MNNPVSLEEALNRITELEKENAKLTEELDYYKKRKMSGRQKHNAKWMTIYNDFVAGYESGMTMVEIAKRNNISERSIYRYKAYYEQMRVSGITEMMNRVKLEEVREDEIEQLYDMQIESFMPLYEKYHDEGSPAVESLERVKGRAAQENRKYYFIVKDGARVGAINIGGKSSDSEESCLYISPIFILPKYQNHGIGFVAIQKAFMLYPNAKVWKLDTILQESANCHLYEKCGFVRVGEEHIINDKMTLIDYEKR